jgi:hypothetical protein
MAALGYRDVPLPERTLTMLREYWVTHRNPKWLFPVAYSKRWPLSVSQTPVSGATVAQAFGAAVKASGIQKDATV